MKILFSTNHLFEIFKNYNSFEDNFLGKFYEKF